MAAHTPRSALLTAELHCLHLISTEHHGTPCVPQRWPPAQELPRPRWALSSAILLEAPEHPDPRSSLHGGLLKGGGLAQTFQEPCVAYPHHHTCNCLPPVRVWALQTRKQSLHSTLWVKTRQAGQSG